MFPALPPWLTQQRLPEESAPVVGVWEETPEGADPGCERPAFRNAWISLTPTACPEDTEPSPFAAGTSPSQGVRGHFHNTQSPWIRVVPQKGQCSFLLFLCHLVIPPACTFCPPASCHQSSWRRTREAASCRGGGPHM